MARAGLGAERSRQCALFVEPNRRDVEEKSEQLRSLSNLAALFAGFQLTALTQLNFQGRTLSLALLAAYGISTALVVSLMTTSLMTTTLMLASVLKNGQTYVSEAAEEEFMMRCRRCEDDWRFAFRLFSIAVPCFMANVVTISWMQFSQPSIAGIMIRAHYHWGFYLTTTHRDQETFLNEAHITSTSGPFDWHLRSSSQSNI
eukprot:jgi/Chlat1/3034/Chrsp206S03286